MFEIKTESPEDRKGLLRSLIVSVIILAVGLGWSYRLGLYNLPIVHQLGHASEDLEGLQKAISAKHTQKVSAK